MRPKIRSLTVRGFRAYGKEPQTLLADSNLVVVWAPNSKGKTSLAEAIEFLITGCLSRRDLMTSTQDEFADALKNVHLAAEEEVFIAAELRVGAATRTVKRTLVRDYGKREACSSTLTIDGAIADDTALRDLGIVLSQPPLQAPVLSQHALTYLFSVGPQGRATYFKSLLEVLDLDKLRNDVATAGAVTARPLGEWLSKVERIRTEVGAGTDVDRLLAKKPIAPPSEFDRVFAALIRKLLEPDHGGRDLSEAVERLTSELARRRETAFPMRMFTSRSNASWEPPSPEIWQRLARYERKRAAADQQANDFAGLFDEAMKLPHVANAAEAVDCPLCEASRTLTPARRDSIRAVLASGAEYRRAEREASQSRASLKGTLQSLNNTCTALLPQFLRSSRAERLAASFSIERVKALVPAPSSSSMLAEWCSSAGGVYRAAIRIQRAVRSASKLVDSDASQAARLALDQCARRYEEFQTALVRYRSAERPMLEALHLAIDQTSATSGWQELIEVAGNLELLREEILDQAASAEVRRQLDEALKQIDVAKEKVLDDKFADYSGLISAWWNRLRPEEPTFFSAMQPRKGAKRTIDLKAGLSTDQGRTAPKFRDVVAVFSQSQLHCLGLAMFLAKAEHEALGFMVLDDPVLSSDEDYRAHFNSSVINALLERDIQSIVFTQNHDTWEELELLYRHVGVSAAQIYVESPAEGSLIENTSNELLAKINRANSLARGGHPDVRKACGLQLRDAGERFCKEMLVRDRRANGDTAALLTDYDGKVLEWLCPHVEPLLVKDPSHPGRLAAFRSAVNKACHDNAPPGPQQMAHACGEIKYLVKQYLGLQT